MAVQVTWLGHSAFMLKINNYTVLIDPFLTGNPLATIRADAIEADYIIVSHGHGDHVGDTVSIAKRTGATVITNFEIGKWFQNKHGLQAVHTLNAGGGVQLPFGRVELTLAFHSSSLPDGTYGGQPNGILILTNEDRHIYHAGDTSVFLDMQLIGERGLDLALLPIGDYFTMGLELSLRAVELLRPKVVIPMHFNTFDPIAQDVVNWAQLIQHETESQPVVLDPGGTYQL
ncbi:MAG TPA: metal-dependent hydrolase [Aggregatilineaceae bacterium]|nr:metal-dependent hydrolase [Aggregatilineaceae bacterium]